ncbi:hypothetical protein [Thermoflavimicrobium daqui]|uniref:Uncharacterized protein n=1 Tax=Thermoflavimicrobium daqui TaxID=2137476 RepID=A0A364K1G2_9BACL|nr:hypothetical protein [Thermoflavimicrobium daqui]RAL21869.1 hypothetical protein DL897_15745 [Thermoflavimicrobium daqui]
MGFFFWKNNKKKKIARISYEQPFLGIQPHHETFIQEIHSLIQHLENSLPHSYIEAVKGRVMGKYKLDENTWKSRWFEWQRYLIMVAILKKVSMYSNEVDEIWHEMLMFTREYDEFCDNFLKTKLHHIPHAPGYKPAPEDRAWFDTVYFILFRPTKYSFTLWGPFLRNPLSSQIAEDFRSLSEEELTQKYFNAYTAQHVSSVSYLISFIIQYIKSEIQSLDHHVQLHGTTVKSYKKTYIPNSKSNTKSLALLSGMFYLSIFHPIHFTNELKLLHIHIEQAFKQKDSSSLIGYSGDAGSNMSIDCGSDGGCSSDGGSGDGGSGDGGGGCGGGCGGGGCGGGS